MAAKLDDFVMKVNIDSKSLFRELSLVQDKVNQALGRNFKTFEFHHPQEKLWESWTNPFSIVRSGDKNQNNRIRSFDEQAMDGMQKSNEVLENARSTGNYAAFTQELAQERAAMAQDFAAKQSLCDAYYARWRESHRSTSSYMLSLSETITDQVGEVVTGCLNGTTTMSDAWKALGENIRQVFHNMVIEWITSQIKMAAFKLLGGIFGFADGGPVTGGKSHTKKSTKLASGGAVFGPGTATSDSIPAWLSKGEYILQAAAVSKLGLPLLNRLNNGYIPAFAAGGIIGGPPLSSLSAVGYKTAGLKNNFSATTKYATEAQSSSPTINLNISALDGKSFERFLDTTGGRKLKRYLAGEVRRFAPAGV